ncbi:hypothetical protein G5714_011752 [Onychostoma macrolepis]|uniref:Uncharacterized protein n=1 Tax=Onychostoma macrolepis TaxID=369639 RepID=A0A7J6CJ91_9TELE|nr:hypothetical protein G5714_011752 [Onychostoma macrolepis]
MKAPGPKSKRCTSSRSSKSRTRGHAAFMYTSRQQVNPTAVGRVRESRGVSRYLLQRVGSEAARLSCFSRHRVITRREIREAWDQLRRRRNSAAPAGA